MSLNSNLRKAAAFLHLHRHQNRTKAAGRMAKACAKVAAAAAAATLAASERAMTHSPFKGRPTATPGDRLYCSQPRISMQTPAKGGGPVSFLPRKHSARQPRGRKRVTAAIYWWLYTGHGAKRSPHVLPLNPVTQGLSIQCTKLGLGFRGSEFKPASAKFGDSTNLAVKWSITRKSVL